MRRSQFRARGPRDTPSATKSSFKEPVTAKWEGSGAPKAFTAEAQDQSNESQPEAGPSVPRRASTGHRTTQERGSSDDSEARSPLSRSMSPITITNTTEGWEDDYNLDDLGLEESDDEDQEDWLYVTIVDYEFPSF